MKPTTYKTIAVVVAIAVLSGMPFLVWHWKSFRDQQYRELIADFRQAVPKEIRRLDNGHSGWGFEFRPAGSETAVRIEAFSDYRDTVRLHYGDEKDARVVYDFCDFCHPVEIRTSGDILYVHRIIHFTRRNHYIIAYDLANRRKITERQIDPQNLAKLNE